MKHRVMGLVIICGLAILFAGCGGGEGENLSQVYRDYHKALQQEDLAALKRYISSGRQEEMLGEGADLKIKLIKEMLPQDINVTKTTVSGHTAVLEVEGKMGKQRMTGSVEFLQEEGQWKIAKENWQINIEMESEEGPSRFSGPVQPFLPDPKILPQVRQTLSGHQGEVTALAFTPDNRYLVSAGYGDYSLRVWDPFTGAEVANSRTPNRVRSLAMVPDGSGVLTADAYNDIILWPLSNGTPGEPQTLLKEAGDAVAISPDGKTIATAGWKRPVRLFALETGKMLDTLISEGLIRVLTFSAAGDILVGGGDGATFHIWDTKKWKDKTYKVGKVMQGSGISSIDISRDGKVMVTGHTDSSIAIFDLQKRRELHNFFVRDAATMAVRFSPDCTLLATAHYDKSIYLWEVASAKRLGVLSRHREAVTSLAFAGDGGMLASGGEDRDIFLWSANSFHAPAATSTPGEESAAKPGPRPAPEVPDAPPAEMMVEVEGQPNLIRFPDARRFTRHWQTKGEVSIEKDAETEDNYNFIVRYSGMIWQDVPIKESTNRYALLIAWASSQRVNTDGDQTGLPYLYGYMLDRADSNKISAYLQGQQMMLSTNVPNEWGVIYGIFPVPPGTGAIRLFLQQADGGQPQNGSAARFDEPGVFLFDTRDEAEAFVKKY
jgi:WD40 repeat protein